MSDVIAYTLFSGSKGNSSLIATKNSQILIDAGMGSRTIEKSLSMLGTSLANITDIFVTHDHGDHTKGLESICKKYDLTVHMTKASAEVILNKAVSGELEEKTQVHPLLFEAQANDIFVSSFATSHDSRASVGYVIKTPTHSIGYATDMGCVTDAVRKNLCGVDSVILEANHDITMLNEGPYPDVLKKRILSRFGHLSNDDAAEFAAYLAENGTKNFLLAHLSEQNNDPVEAFSSVYCALGDIKKRNISLAVADPCLPTRLI